MSCETTSRRGRRPLLAAAIAWLTVGSAAVPTRRTAAAASRRTADVPALRRSQAVGSVDGTAHRTLEGAGRLLRVAPWSLAQSANSTADAREEVGLNDFLEDEGLRKEEEASHIIEAAARLKAGSETHTAGEVVRKEIEAARIIDTEARLKSGRGEVDGTTEAPEGASRFAAEMREDLDDFMAQEAARKEMRAAQIIDTEAGLQAQERRREADEMAGAKKDTSGRRADTDADLNDFLADEVTRREMEAAHIVEAEAKLKAQYRGDGERAETGNGGNSAEEDGQSATTDVGEAQSGWQTGEGLQNSTTITSQDREVQEMAETMVAKMAEEEAETMQASDRQAEFANATAENETSKAPAKEWPCPGSGLMGEACDWYEDFIAANPQPPLQNRSEDGLPRLPDRGHARWHSGDYLMREACARNHYVICVKKTKGCEELFQFCKSPWDDHEPMGGLRGISAGAYTWKIFAPRWRARMDKLIEERQVERDT